MIFHGQKELDSALAYWQKALRLQDWQVKVKIVRTLSSDIETNNQGDCEVNLKRKEATIRLLDPTDYPPDVVWEQDMEVVLAHELIHLHTHLMRYAAYPDDASMTEMYVVAEEQAVQMWASSIVEMRRADTSFRSWREAK